MKMVKGKIPKEINKIPTEEYFASGHRACAGCGCAIAVRTALKAAGKDTIVVSATGCMEVVSSPYPQSSWRVPWIHGAFETAGSIASGVERALKHLKKKTKVLAIGGDGGTFDIGLQALSGAAERGHDFCYVCYDNAAYMNTGVQRSGATPKYASTTTSPAGKVVPGKKEQKKNMPFIMAAHRAYVATANIAFPQDFIEKVRKGLAYDGPAYIQVFATCPTGWKSLGNLSIEIPRLAYQTKVTPLYEIEEGKLKFTKPVNSPKPVEEYLKTQGRFKHLTKEQIAEIQEYVDEEYERLQKIEASGVRMF